MDFHPDMVLLQIAFFQDGSSDWYDFQLEAMFVESVDSIAEPYDFSFEMSESQIRENLITYGEVRKYGVRNLWNGERYIVIRDYLDNFSIYRPNFTFEED